MRKIRKGDEVIVIAGKDKGRRGVVLLRKDDERLLVEGINMVKKHVRPNPAANTQGGIETRPMPIHQSNVAIFNPVTGKADRVGIKLGEDGTRSRIFKSNGAPVPVPARPTSAAA